MSNFNIQNFVLLSRALKDLPKKKKSSYSLIGAMSTGGLGGILPAYALGRAEIAKNRAKEAEERAARLGEKTEAQSEKTQTLYAQIGAAFADSRADATKAAVIEATRETVDALGLKAVKDDNGDTVLPGAQILQPDLPLSEVTARELGSIAQGVATAFADALNKGAVPCTDTDG